MTPEQQALAAQWLRYAQGLAIRFTCCKQRHRAEAESEAVLVLCRAAAKFDPHRGVPFPAYLRRCIFKRLSRLARTSWLTSTTSLDKMNEEDRQHELKEYKEWQDQCKEAEWLADGLARLRSAVTVTVLSRAEREVIELHYLGDPTWTLTDIGVKNRLSKERIRQIKEAALHKLRQVLN